MKEIKITIKNKIASSPPDVIICGNSDYKIIFNFDEEWSGHNVKTARFIFANSTVDVVFEGNSCAVPIVSKSKLLIVGVFAGDLKTTTPARIVCEPSILCFGGVPADPPEDVYTQIINKLGNVETALDEIIDIQAELIGGGA